MSNKSDEIHEINAITFRKMIVESVNLLSEYQGYLNSINVFPVPDRDTGSNMLHTMTGVKVSLEVLSDSSFETIGKEVIKACLLNARGNVGVILSEYFKGFVAEIKSSHVIKSAEFVKALSHGSNSAWQAMKNPQKGTILDVFDAAAKGAKVALEHTKDFSQILSEAQRHALEALHETRNILPQMKKAGVVDAGGAGFFLVINGFRIGVDGSSAIVSDYLVSAPIKVNDEEPLFRYCAEAVIMKSKASKEEVMQRIGDLGDSLQIATYGDLLKLHIHTNEPELVDQICQNVGDVKNWKVDDMRDNQNRYHKDPQISEDISDLPCHTISNRIAENKIAVVTDSSSNLPNGWLHMYPIFVVDIPVTLSGDPINLAKNMTLKEFYSKMATKKDFIPLTSQPNVSQFVKAYKEALKVADIVFCLPISSELSGAYHNAVQAKEEVGSDRIHVVDSHTMSSGLTMLINLVFNSQSEEKCCLDMLPELYAFRDRMEQYFIVDTTKYLSRGGRLLRIEHFLSQLLHINPLLQLKEGSIRDTGQKIYFSNPEKQLLLLVKQVQRAIAERKLTHVYIIHSDAENKAFRLKEYLIKKLNLSESLIQIDEFGMVIGAHIGPGAIALIWT